MRYSDLNSEPVVRGVYGFLPVEDYARLLKVCANNNRTIKDMVSKILVERLRGEEIPTEEDKSEGRRTEGVDGGKGQSTPERPRTVGEGSGGVEQPPEAGGEIPWVEPSKEIEWLKRS